MNNANYKWTISVLFQVNKKVDLTAQYNEFKQRMLQSIKGCRVTNFSDKHQSFWKMCDKPAEVFEYFYALNPIPGDDILDGAKVTIQRTLVQNRKARPDKPKHYFTKETGAIVEGGED